MTDFRTRLILARLSAVSSVPSSHSHYDPPCLDVVASETTRSHTRAASWRTNHMDDKEEDACTRNQEASFEFIRQMNDLGTCWVGGGIKMNSV